MSLLPFARILTQPVTCQMESNSGSVAFVAAGVRWLSAVSTNEADSGFLLAGGFGLIAVTWERR